MNGPTVVIAEDEEVIVEGLKIFLESKGFKVLTASNGEKALELTLRERPAVLVLDLTIPKLSGVEVCQRVKAAPGMQRIKILITTGMGRQEAGVRDALAAGADGFLPKPFGGARLLEEVNRV